MKRRVFMLRLGAVVTLAPGISLRAFVPKDTHSNLTKASRQLMVSETEPRAWHVAQDSMGGPTMAGSPSWHSYLQLLENSRRRGHLPQPVPLHTLVHPLSIPTTPTGPARRRKKNQSRQLCMHFRSHVRRRA
jgi:hypothetical protein